jgi:hypothetical protein
MRLPVPFYEQTTEDNCGPVALRMILEYLGKNFTTEELETATGIKEGKMLATIQLATTAAELGFKVDFFTKELGFDESKLETEYYKKYAEEGFAEMARGFVKKAENAGVNVKKRSLTLKELLNFVSENSIPLILLNWNIVKGKEGHHGHFVPVVGYDNENIYVHNHGKLGTQPYFPIKRDLFDKARKSEGTSEDLVIIYRKQIK